MQPSELDRVPVILEAVSGWNDPSIATPAWFRWKFWGSPFGPAVVACAECSSGRIAGVVAFGLYALTHGPDDVVAALSYETFVAPEFRGQGLFTRLMHLGMSECSARGVRMMFNFPNAASLPGFVKQGWILDQCIHSSARPSNWIGCVTHFDPGIRRASFVPDVIAEFDPRDYEGLEVCLSAMPGIRSDGVWAALRTPEYMLWRYQTHPLFRYVVIRDDSGWAMVRTGRRGRYTEVQILELFPSAAYGPAFLRALCRRVARRLGPDIITLSVSQAHPVFSSLRRAGFWPIPFRGHFTYYPIDPALRENRAWVITSTEFHTY